MDEYEAAVFLAQLNAGWHPLTQGGLAQYEADRLELDEWVASYLHNENCWR